MANVQHNSKTGSDLHAAEREYAGNPHGNLSGLKGQYCKSTSGATSGKRYVNTDGTTGTPTTNWTEIFDPAALGTHESAASAHDAANIDIADAGDYFTGSTTEAALQELASGAVSPDIAAHVNADGAGGSSAPAANKVHNAAAVDIEDDGDFITATDVEGALQEIAEAGLDSKYYTEGIEDWFPAKQCWIRNTEMNNNLALSAGTEITVASVDTGANTITLSWLPYKETIMSPVEGQEWALLNLDLYSGTADPDIGGTYTDLLKITGGVYATKVLNYTVIMGAEGNWQAGHRVLLYNMFEMGWTFGNSGSPIISTAGSGWRSTYVAPGPIFRHSNGNYIMLVTGVDGSGVWRVGAFQATPAEFPDTWTVMNSDAAIFVPQGGTWCHSRLAIVNNIYKLDAEDRYIGYFWGKNSGGRLTTGWAKFDEDFGNIEYSTLELVSRTSSYDHHFPTVVRYGGVFRISYNVDTAPGSPSYDYWDQSMYEAFSLTPEGPFTNPALILAMGLTNDGTFRSSHVTDLNYFIFRNRLYGLLNGTSRYRTSGNRANSMCGLMYWDERKDTPAWVEDKRNPIFINPLYASASLWGAQYEWASDHFGGRQVFIRKGNTLYVFTNCNNGTDSYKIMYLSYQLP